MGKKGRGISRDAGIEIARPIARSNSRYTVLNAAMARGGIADASDFVSSLGRAVESLDKALGGDIAAFSPVMLDPPFNTGRDYRILDTSHVPMAPVDPSDSAGKIYRATRKALLNSSWGLMTSSRGSGTLPAILADRKAHEPGTVIDTFSGSGTTGAAVKTTDTEEFIKELRRMTALPRGEREPAMMDYLASIPESANKYIKMVATAMARKLSETWWGPVRLKANVPRPDTGQSVDPARATTWLRSQLKSMPLPAGTRRTSNP